MATSAPSALFTKTSIIASLSNTLSAVVMSKGKVVCRLPISFAVRRRLWLRSGGTLFLVRRSAFWYRGRRRIFPYPARVCGYCQWQHGPQAFRRHGLASLCRPPEPALCKAHHAPKPKRHPPACSPRVSPHQLRLWSLLVFNEGNDVFHRGRFPREMAAKWP